MSWILWERERLRYETRFSITLFGEGDISGTISFTDMGGFSERRMKDAVVELNTAEFRT